MQNHLHHVGILSFAIALVLPCASTISIAQDFVVTHTGTEVFRVANGKLGINMTTAPLYPLTFNSFVGDKIAFTIGSTNHYGIGLQSNLLQIHTSSSSADIGFGYGSSASFTEVMRVKGNGNVGIGINPIYKLDIAGSLNGALMRVENTGTATFSNGAYFTSSGGYTSSAVKVNSINGLGLEAYSGRYGVYANGAIKGVHGFSSGGVGVWGEATGLSGVGVEGWSDNYKAVYGTSSTGTGVYASSISGKGLYCSGDFYASSSNFEVNATNIIWNANKPATVKLNNGSKIKLFSEEAAEVYFNDYGEGQLKDGRARIELDPIFLQVVTIDVRRPMKVFVQLEDDCKGVYITNKTFSSFDVAEIQGGSSNARFTFRVVCKRKYYEDERLATLEQDSQYNTHMMETAWPEVVARRQAEVAEATAKQQKVKAEREVMKQTHQRK